MYLAVGSNVLALLVFVCYPKLPGMILALIVMGISACFGKTAQQMYFLDLKSVKEYGEDKSIGIYNFTENIGESLGPVVLGQIMFISPLAKGVLPLCMIVTGMGGIYYLINRKKWFIVTVEWTAAIYVLICCKMTEKRSFCAWQFGKCMIWWTYKYQFVTVKILYCKKTHIITHKIRNLDARLFEKSTCRHTNRKYG